MSDRPSGRNGRLLSTAKEINRSVINLLKDGVKKKKNVNVMEREKNSDESLSGGDWIITFVQSELVKPFVMMAIMKSKR